MPTTDTPPPYSRDTHTAFCYATQQWLTGEPARAELLRQCLEERALVMSPDGPRYLASIGCDKPLPEVLAWLQQQLVTLSQPPI